uniref:Uncharacterized protein n=1 Tax=Pygocentrus nattereri TaxID=42514 RepID=A0A3B4EAX9_PYGNA
MATLLARKLILLKWNSPVPPSHSMWISELCNVVKMEKIRSVKSSSIQRFYNTWNPFFDYLHKFSPKTEQKMFFMIIHIAICLQFTAESQTS